MRRVDVLALAGVAALLGAALVYGQREDAPPVTAEPRLVQLRQEAALAPCPASLAADLAGVVLPCLGGGPDVDLGGTPARPTLVNVWGSWCAPCVDEVPDLVAYAAKAAGRVDVLGVLTQDTEVNGLAFAKDFSMRYPNLVDDDGLVRARYGGGTPLTLFVDAAGTVTHVEAGKVDSLAELEALTVEHLGITL